MDFNQLRALMKASRSVRRFHGNRQVDPDILHRLVELTRYCPSGRNAQPLRYLAVTDANLCNQIFPLLKWAGYLPDWDGPVESERPTAYLIQFLDTELANDCLCDDGLQLEALTLGARSLGLADCIIKAFNAPRLQNVTGVPERYRPRYVMALGYPVEEVVIEDTNGTLAADIRYYRTPDGIHHVPKRPLAELLL